ncbi:MAG TPA: hypothetical protein VFM65_11285 [Flavobacteriaceae bacterium]|nr:hypothetical protein [Flavobacteriaceae bacterium]
MNNILRNKAKNIGFLRELYRSYTQKHVKNKLLEGVGELKSMDAASFEKQQTTPFKNLSLENTEKNRQVVNDPGFKIYFRSQENNSHISVTDQFNGAPYFTRQRMLATAYNYIGLENLKNYSMADLAGSCGYYSFLAAPFGFDKITVLEGRKEYEEQFSILREKTAVNSIDWNQKDVTQGIETYDVVLCQGLLYHLYDHLGFLSMLFNKTKHILILETELSGHKGFLNYSKYEDVADNRQGLAGIAMYPSYLTVISLLKTVGFKKITRVAPPTDVADLHGYNKNRRTMLICEK